MPEDKFKRVPADLANRRCYFCSEYPGLAGKWTITVNIDGSGFYWGICASCVDKMHALLHENF